MPAQLGGTVCSIFSPGELCTVCRVLCVPVYVHVCVFTVHVLLHYRQAHYTNPSHALLLCKQAQRCDDVNLAL